MPDSRSSASEYSRTSVSINSSSDEDDGSESEISVFSGNGRETRLICQNANQHREQVNAINSTVSIGPHINTHGSGKVTIKNYFGGTEIAPEALRSIIHNSISDDSNRKEIGDSQERPQSAENTSTNINERSYHSSPIQSDSIHARIRQWSAQISSNLTKNDKLTLFICIILFIVIPASALTVYFTIYEIEANIPEPSTQESIKEQTTLFTETGDSLTFTTEGVEYRSERPKQKVEFDYYTRQDWGASPPKIVEPMQHPTEHVVIAHTASVRCSTLTSCARILRTMQENNQRRGMNDIGYNFLISDDGAVYEGRGWNASSMKGNNFLYIGFMGNYEKDELNQRQENKTMKFLEYGTNIGFLDKNYKLIAHSQVKGTLSPGRNIYNAIVKWPHYVYGQF